MPMLSLPGRLERTSSFVFTNSFSKTSTAYVKNKQKTKREKESSEVRVGFAVRQEVEIVERKENLKY